MAFRFNDVLTTNSEISENQDVSSDQQIDTSPLSAPQEMESEASSKSDSSDSTAVTPVQERKSTSSRGTKTASGTRGAKRSPSGKNADSVKRCQIGFWLTLSERRALRSVCVNNDTNITSFTSSAVLDAMRYTYECTSASCQCQFTLRSRDDTVPEKAVSCPVCGGKVSAVRY